MNKKKNILAFLILIISIPIFINRYSWIRSEFGKIFSENQKKSTNKLLNLQYCLPNFTENTDIDGIVFSKYETEYKSSNLPLQLGKLETIKLSNNKYLQRYKIVEGFYAGINNKFPGSGFIDFHKDNLVILSSRGILSFGAVESELNKLSQIRNNTEDFIGMEHFKKGNSFSIKDIKIVNDVIYISYTEEIKKNCFNTSVIYGEFNYDNIKFKKLFSPIECININGGDDKEFNAHQSGGRIIPYKNDLLLSVGDYRRRTLAQDKKSINGKILKIKSFNSNSFEVISLGHRNPQGLLYDSDRNFLISTEHGPMGGDEINLIKIPKSKILSPPNYGWPVVSAGEHYGGKTKKNENKYKKYPLYKSHTKYGFMEPLKSFAPSIGISEVVKIDKNSYVTSSLRDESLYFFKINEKEQIVELNRVPVFERVRDLHYREGKIYLFLEDSATLGIINTR